MAGLKPRAGSYLEFIELPRRKNSLDIAPNAVLSPITELAKNFEYSLGRTPKRKLSLSGNDPLPLTPNTAGFQRSLSTVSNESGYCPDSPPGFDFDSPSMEVLKANAEKRKQRRPSFKRWNSLPVESGEDPFTANKENIELNFDTLNHDSETKTADTVCPSKDTRREFKFAQPKCPVGGRLSKSSQQPLRSLSDPSPQVQSRESFIPSSPSECSSQCDFDCKADGDDDGFIDDFFQEQKENNTLEVPSGITELVSAPLVSKEAEVDNTRKGSKDTPKASEPGYKPRDLFNAGRDRAHTVASESPTKEDAQ
ncbi:hypothetical protein OS493_025633 [Desmophyllum pertusum]|uniref:Uncharacterized protein n=1 Tax=Desmophyllum pertusum TaxID=174260 RepID=A0A9W9ZYW0_9CNID|nr:hypothetical protein OS493_025633 [Desmophyllum pertusum]